MNGVRQNRAAVNQRCRKSISSKRTQLYCVTPYFDRCIYAWSLWLKRHLTRELLLHIRQ